MFTCIADRALGISWRQLREESCALRERGLSNGTWANKISHLRAYISFTTYYGVEDFPILLGVLLRFIALLARGPYAYGSAANVISNLKWFTRLLDPSSEKIFETVLVSASLRGLKAQLSRPLRQKLPFTVAHMAQLHDLLDLANSKHLAAWCAMLLAFFGCFRLSNLVPTSSNKFNPRKHLSRADVKFEGNYVLIFYKWSKTHQNPRKVSWIPIHSVSDSRFNVKCYFKALLSGIKAPSDAPLFSYEKKKFHSRYSLVRLLDQCVYKAGLQVADYSWHSFRRGAAVFAFELGLSDSAVQLLGDWSSDAFKQYLEFAFSRKADVARKVAKSFDFFVEKL